MFPLGSDLCAFVNDGWETMEGLLKLKDPAILPALREKNVYIYIAYREMLDGNDIIPYLKERHEQISEFMEFIANEREQYTGELITKANYLPKKLSFEYDVDGIIPIEVATIETLDNLFFFDLYNTIKGRLLIKKCKNCGRFFVPRGRTDIEYCNHIAKGETKSCAQIGAVRKFKEKQENNKILAEFQKAYKRNHAKIKAGKWTEQEFVDWSNQARESRDLAIAGKISEKKFIETLKQDNHKK